MPGQTLTLQCHYCGMSFVRQLKNMHKNPKNKLHFCNRKCYGQFKGETNTIKAVCTQCGLPVSRKLSQHKLSKSRHMFCNNVCSARYNNKHKATGTRRSKVEAWLEQQLTAVYPNLEFKFNTLELMGFELDIFVPSLKVGFEINGLTHFRPIYGQEKFDRMQTNDSLKRRTCQERGIHLHVVDVSAQKRFSPETSVVFFLEIQDVIKARLAEETGVKPAREY